MALTPKISQLRIGDVEINFTNEGIVLKEGRGSVTVSEEILDIIKETLAKNNGNGIIKEDK